MSRFAIPLGYPQRLYRADTGEYVTGGGFTVAEGQAFARQAADFIEQNPGRYSFNKGFTPNGDDPASVGCMLGWMGCFAGAPVDTPVGRVSVAILGVPEMVFYLGYVNWAAPSYQTAPGAAAHLRAYAQQLPRIAAAA